MTTDAPTHRRTRLAVLAAGLALLLTTAGLATATPASAAKQCRENWEQFRLPGKPDLSVTIRSCVWTYGSGGVAGHAYVDWGSWDGWGAGQRFNRFEFRLYLQPGGGPGIARRVHCDMTAKVNEQIDAPGNGFLCTLPGAPRSSASTWTVDAMVRYDVRDDGVGPFNYWKLMATPAI